MVHFFHSCLCFLVWLCMVTQILGDNSTKNKQVASCQNDPPVNQHRRGKSTILQRSMGCPFRSVCLPQGISEYMEVSLNRGTPKSSILVGLSIINHPFWGTPIPGNPGIASNKLYQHWDPDWCPPFCYSSTGQSPSFDYLG
jgi:hypothetical protein